MGNFDWRAGIGQASKGLREDREQRRAYTRADEEMALQMSQMLGMDMPESLKKKLPMTFALFGGKNVSELKLAQEEAKAQRLMQSEIKKQEMLKEKGLGSYYSKPEKPSALQEKLNMLDTPGGKEKLQALAEIANTLSVKDQAYLKNLGLDIQIKERKLTGNEPIPTQELERYPEEVAGTTYKEVREKGTRPLSVKDRDVLANIRKGRAIIKRAKALADQLITAEGPAEVNIQRAKLGLGKVSGMNPQAKKYMDFIEANKSVIAKALKMQVGNLAIEEQEAAKAEFAQFNDWKQTSQDKYDNLMRQLDSNEQSILTGKYVEPEPLSESEGGNPDPLGIR